MGGGRPKVQHIVDEMYLIRIDEFPRLWSYCRDLQSLKKIGKEVDDS